MQVRACSAGADAGSPRTRLQPLGRLRSILAKPGLAASVGRILWPVVDQGIASLGGFLLTIALARTLAPGEYGNFALFLGVEMLLFTAISSLVFYPMSVLSNVSSAARGAQLMRASVALLLLLCVPATACLCFVGVLLGRIDLILPVVTYFIVWQVQETFRRCLFAELRFAAAIPGEIISYFGQILILFWLYRHDGLTLTSALYAMAATSGLAAILQAFQTGLVSRGCADLDLRNAAGSFLRLGRWSLAGNLAAAMRQQAVFWFLAALSGDAMPGLLLAGINIVNILNPLIIGLSNVIPQVTARAHLRGKIEALRAARPFAFSGLLMAIAFLAVVAAIPERVLSAIYGAGSIYADLAMPVRLLTVGAVISYIADMICSYFHGVTAVRQAMIANIAGMTASVVTAAPLIIGFGLNGACIALCIANAVRVLVSSILLRRLIADERSSAACRPIEPGTPAVA
jgi:O-antigen/teichoic acid export membrane protein